MSIFENRIRIFVFSCVDGGFSGNAVLQCPPHHCFREFCFYFSYTTEIMPINAKMYTRIITKLLRISISS